MNYYYITDPGKVRERNDKYRCVILIDKDYVS